MRRGRVGLRGKLAVGAGLILALVVGLVLGSRAYPDRGPASAAVLNSIAAKNEEAATVAAAHMKSESQAATSAADARLRAEDEAREQSAENGTSE